MNISCKCSQIVFAVQRSDLLCRRLPQIYALHPILFYQRILGKIHLRPNLSNILIYLLITNALQHSTTTFFTTTAGKVTQDHELAITPHIEIGLHNTPPPPWLVYLHQVGEPKPMFSRFLVTVNTLPLGESAGQPLLLCAALL